MKAIKLWVWRLCHPQRTTNEVFWRNYSNNPISSLQTVLHKHPHCAVVLPAPDRCVALNCARIIKPQSKMQSGSNSSSSGRNSSDQLGFMVGHWCTVLTHPPIPWQAKVHQGYNCGTLCYSSPETILERQTIMHKSVAFYHIQQRQRKICQIIAECCLDPVFAVWTSCGKSALLPAPRPPPRRSHTRIHININWHWLQDTEKLAHESIWRVTYTTVLNVSISLVFFEECGRLDILI